MKNRKYEISHHNASIILPAKHIHRIRYGGNYHKGFPAKGSPTNNATRIPTQIKSWLTEPSAPRISVGEICKAQTECLMARKNGENTHTNNKT